MNIKTPSVTEFKRQLGKLSSRIIKTPIHTWDSPSSRKRLGNKTKPVFKLELLQRTGSFKIRGAFTFIDQLSEEEKSRGIVAGTGGNHGLAVALATSTAGVDAKIIVPKSINKFRLDAIKSIGATIVEVDHISMILEEMLTIAKKEGRTIMHPFEHPAITLGTGTLGLELLEQAPDLEVVLVPIGGGGLASGVACAVKKINPMCKVIGVEPVKANSMQLSIQNGSACTLEQPPCSIADSLCSPRAEQYSFSVCQKYLDSIVTVSEQEIIDAMKLLFEELKLAAEPAGAATTAALLGGAFDICHGKKVGIIVCGSNIDTESFFTIIRDRQK